MFSYRLKAEFLNWLNIKFFFIHLTKNKFLGVIQNPFSYVILYTLIWPETQSVRFTVASCSIGHSGIQIFYCFYCLSNFPASGKVCCKRRHPSVESASFHLLDVARRMHTVLTIECHCDCEQQTSNFLFIVVFSLLLSSEPEFHFM